MATVVHAMAAPNLLFLMILITGAVALNPDPPPSAPMYVLIQNKLPGNLNVHCFTKNSDMHLHPVPPGAEYEFLFHLNFLGTTSFHCRFNYVGTKLWQAFNVWNGPGIWGYKFWPCRQCIWMVNLDGFFRAQEGKPLIIVHPWRRDPENFLIESKDPESP